MPDVARPPRPIVTSLRPDGLGEDTVARVATVLAEAFVTDPYTVAFLPEDRRVERLTRKFSAAIRDLLRPLEEQDRVRLPSGAPHAETAADPARLTRGAVDVAVDPESGALLGAALWERPETPRAAATLPGRVAAVPELVRVHGRHALALARTVSACERARPRAPHWYLMDLGTTPAAQGRGAGSALLRRRQRSAREAGVGVYLESSTRANVPFYERFGLTEVGPVRAVGTADLTGMRWEA